VSGSSGQPPKSRWWAGVKAARYPKPVKLGRASPHGASRISARQSRNGSMNRNRRPDWRRIKRKLSYTIGRER
jgi:hypothetical protein